MWAILRDERSYEEWLPAILAAARQED